MNEKALQIQRELTPTTWAMIEAIAATTANSAVQVPEIAQKLLFCFENDLPLGLAVNGGLYVVKKRLEVEGTTIRAQIRKHPNYGYTIDRLNDRGCQMTFTFDGEPLGTVEFTEADAKQADLLGKENWKKFPADMYLGRATSRGYKRFCPDLFMQSVYVRGEIAPETAVPIGQGEIQALIEQHGETVVLDAMTNAGGSIEEMETYLREVE